jgi:hypothetical protein
MNSKQGRKPKYDSDEDRIAIAKKQRDKWRREHTIVERNIRNNSSPFQKQLIFYLKRTILEPELESTLEELFRESFIVISNTLPTPEPLDNVPIFIYDDTTLKIKKRINPKNPIQLLNEEPTSE